MPFITHPMLCLPQAPNWLRHPTQQGGTGGWAWAWALWEERSCFEFVMHHRDPILESINLRPQAHF